MLSSRQCPRESVAIVSPPSQPENQSMIRRRGEYHRCDRPHFDPMACRLLLVAVGSLSPGATILDEHVCQSECSGHRRTARDT